MIGRVPRPAEADAGGAARPLEGMTGKPGSVDRQTLVHLSRPSGDPALDVLGRAEPGTLQGGECLSGSDAGLAIQNDGLVLRELREPRGQITLGNQLSARDPDD